MPRHSSSRILGTLSRLPWWWSILTATTVYGLLVYGGAGYLLPKITGYSLVGFRLSEVALLIAPYIAGIFLLPVPVSLFNSWRKRKQLDQQKNIQTIRGLSWRNFEELVGETYRRRGYRVIENDSAGADGGVDLILHKNGTKHLVQCKQWRAQKIGVAIIREMFGLMAAESADSGIVICSGRFTRPAYDFAQGKPLELIGGEQLMRMIREVQVESNCSPVELDDESGELPCPDCGSKMILRTARKGERVGRQFWGCSQFPSCHGTRNFSRIREFF